jgi:hypothetical protein
VIFVWQFFILAQMFLEQYLKKKSFPVFLSSKKILLLRNEEIGGKQDQKKEM